MSILLPSVYPHTPPAAFTDEHSSFATGYELPLRKDIAVRSVEVPVQLPETACQAAGAQTRILIGHLEGSGEWLWSEGVISLADGDTGGRDIARQKPSSHPRADQHHHNGCSSQGIFTSQPHFQPVQA